MSSISHVIADYFLFLLGHLPSCASEQRGLHVALERGLPVARAVERGHHAGRRGLQNGLPPDPIGRSTAVVTGVGRRLGLDMATGLIAFGVRRSSRCGVRPLPVRLLRGLPYQAFRCSRARLHHDRSAERPRLVDVDQWMQDRKVRLKPPKV